MIPLSPSLDLLTEMHTVVSRSGVVVSHVAKFPHLEHPSQCRQYMTDRIDLAESVGTLNGSERIHERKEVSLAVAKSATSPCRALHCV